MSDDMTLAFSFPDPSASFVHGYEAGKVGAHMEQEAVVIDCGCDEGFPVHEENMDLFRRMAAYYGYEITLGSLVDGWQAVTFAKVCKPRPSLSVVP